MKRRDFVSFAGAWMGAALMPWRRSFPFEERFVERWSWAMGQSVHIMLFAESEDAGLEACAAALAELRRVEARLSLFDEASDLCELNRRAGRRALPIGEDLRAVLSAAETFRAETTGAFNVAVEPLMRTWGFHRPRTTPPPETEILEAREAVRAAVVRIDGDVVSLPSAHTQLDFGGIAVGYGIDRATQILRKHEIRRAFIDISGDCYGLGAPPGDPDGWRVDIAGTSRSARLRNTALATSSNLVSVIRLGRQLIGHIMDPATGRPVPGRQQVTVMQPSAIAADARSTAALVQHSTPSIRTA